MPVCLSDTEEGLLLTLIVCIVLIALRVDPSAWKSIVPLLRAV